MCWSLTPLKCFRPGIKPHPAAGRNLLYCRAVRLAAAGVVALRGLDAGYLGWITVKQTLDKRTREKKKGGDLEDELLFEACSYDGQYMCSDYSITLLLHNTLTVFSLFPTI